MENNKEKGIQTRGVIMDFIEDYFTDHGYCPSYIEIGEAVGIKSKSSVSGHIHRLLEEGLLETDAQEHTPRALRVVGFEFKRKKMQHE